MQSIRDPPGRVGRGTRKRSRGLGVPRRRPSDEKLAKIGRALASNGDPLAGEPIVRDLRRLYWLSEIAQVLGEHIGSDAAANIVVRLQRYVSLSCLALKDESAAQPRPSDLEELMAVGVYAPFAQPLLAALAKSESDDDWKDDLMAAGTDWDRRVLRINRQVHRAEVDALIHDTDGRILRNWDVSDPRAYEHYQRSAELQMQGKMDEALIELAKAIELDPLDPRQPLHLGFVQGSCRCKERRRGPCQGGSRGVLDCGIT